MGPAPMIASFRRILLEAQDDIGETEILESAIERLLERRGCYVEQLRPVDDLEHLGNDERPQLVGSEGWVAINQRVYPEQQEEYPIRNADDTRARAGHAADSANKINIIDLPQAGDVVLARGGVRDAGRHDGCKIAGIQGLARVAPAARNRKYRRALHEASQPSEMLSVEPPEHEGRPQDHVRDGGLLHQRFLLLLRLDVEILGGRIDHRGADVDQVRNASIRCRRQHAARGGHVVTYELLAMRPANLGVQQDELIATPQRFLPRPGFGAICLDEFDLRMQRPQDGEIVCVLVEPHDCAVACCAQVSDKILPDETRDPGYKYPLGHRLSSRRARLARK